MAASLGNDQAKVLECVDRTFKADLLQGHLAGSGGFSHQTTNQVVSNEVEHQFAVEHWRSFAPQAIQLLGGFDIAQEQFYFPAAQVKLSQLGRRVGEWVLRGW